MDVTSALPPPLTARDVLRILKRRALLALVTFTLVCGLTLYLTSKMPKVYQSMARVYISGPTVTAAPANVMDMFTGAGNNPLEVEVEKIQSWDFLSRVIARYGSKGLTPEALKGMMRATPGPGGQILDISVKADTPIAAQKLANLVSAQYIALVKQEYEDRVDQSQKRLRDASVKALQEKAETEAKLNGFLRDVGISDPSLIYTTEAAKTVQVRGTLSDMKRTLPLQEMRLRDLQKYFKVLNPDVYSGVTLLKNGVIDPYKSRIADLKVQKAKLLIDYAPDSPEVMEVDREITIRSEAVASAQKDPFSKSQRSVTRNPEYTNTRSRINELTLEIAAMKREIDTQERREKQLSAAQRTYAVERSRFENLKSQRDGATQRYEQARDGLAKMDLTRGPSAPSLKIMESARVPEYPISPKPGLNVIMAIALGLMLSLGAALIAEYAASGTMLDESVLTDSLPQVGGIPLLGVLPLALPAPSTYGDGLPVPLAGRVGSGLAEDVLREIGFTLAHRHAKEPVPVVLLSGTRSDETTAAVAAQLAATLVRDGVRVTLVDADRALPRLNRVFGQADAPGLADVLAGTKLVRDILHVGADGNLRFLAAGSPGDTTPLTEAGLRQVFKQLADGRDTDIVIVSGPSVWQVPLVGPLEKAAGGLVLLTPGGDGIMGTTPADSVARARRLLSNGYKPRLRGVIIGLDEPGHALVVAAPAASSAALPDSDHETRA